MADDEPLTALMKQVIGMIAAHGWAVQGVVHPEDPTRNVMYTVGLIDRDLPEFVVRAELVEDGYELLETLAGQAVYGGHRYAADDEATVLGRSVRFVDAAEPDRLMPIARINAEVEGNPLRALEVEVLGG